MPPFLILEDEPWVAMDLAYAFEDAGYEAITARNVVEAKEALQRTQFAGAVLDVNLGPGQTCEEAVTELRKRAIPFVLHTGDLNRSGEFIRSLGAPVIAKPQPSDEVARKAIELSKLP